jgi:homocysteine S-methyltransferase
MLIDGGLSNALEAQGCSLHHRLWSARYLDRDPEAIISAHLSYLEAGAECITTASYQASVAGFIGEGYDQQTAESLILKAVSLAEQAIERFISGREGAVRPLIAASIGPYGAYLADGSEYRGKYGTTTAELEDFHRTRLALLDNSPAHILACETIPDFREATVLARLLEKAHTPAWLSFSCRDDGRLNDGTPVEKVIAQMADHPTIFAVGVNCTAPKHVSGLIKKIRLHADRKKIIVYPNSGQAYNAATKTWLGTADPTSLVIMAEEWLNLGADIIGGCCRIGPEHIRGLKRVIKGR